MTNYPPPRKKLRLVLSYSHGFNIDHFNWITVQSNAILVDRRRFFINLN